MVFVNEADGALSFGGAQGMKYGVPSFGEVLGRRTWNYAVRACCRQIGGVVGSSGGRGTPGRLRQFRSPGREGGPSYP